MPFYTTRKTLNNVYMNPFSMPVTLRWADFDINGHLRHSVYYDFGATARVQFMEQYGLTIETMIKLQIGPVLFREEALFRREVRWGDELRVTLWVTKLKHDFSRFSFRHELIKGDDSVAAVMNVDGAWIDMQLRKLAKPPEVVASLSEQAPRSEDFMWQE